MEPRGSVLLPTGDTDVTVGPIPGKAARILNDCRILRFSGPYWRAGDLDNAQGLPLSGGAPPERRASPLLIEPEAVKTELTDHITRDASRESSKKFYDSIDDLQSEDIARAVAYVVSQPPHVAINEILVRPTEQAQP